jgi:hypothetical protein
MSLSRRDVVKLGTAIGLGTVAPTRTDFVAARTILEQPTGATPGSDPAAFAIAVDAGLATSRDLSDEWWPAITPGTLALVREAQEDLERLVPEVMRSGWSAYAELDAGLGAMVLDAYSAGLRHGAAYEHLRRSMFGEGGEA